MKTFLGSTGYDTAGHSGFKGQNRDITPEPGRSTPRGLRL
jgi:hypothetical protein